MNPETDGWVWSGAAFADWRSVVDQRLESVFAITIDDAGFDEELLESHWRDEEPPFEFVRWYGDKYDLEPRKPGWLCPNQVVARHQ